jgi:2-polyprenyl-3-methyl-5-hydroxy-6-metoxy-1,4-benzoquinol methylase
MSEFDARAATWDSDPAKLERARKVADVIMREISDLGHRSVLDYGSGTGLLGFELLPRASSITFADTSEGMLAVVRDKIARGGEGRAEALRLDLATDAAPTHRFDLICSLMTMHHVTDVRSTLRAMHSVLSPGGVLAISDLDTEDGSFHGTGFTGHNGFDRRKLESMIRASGFGPASYFTPCDVRKEVAGVMRTFPLFLAIARRRS